MRLMQVCILPQSRGLIGAAKALALELAEYGITVNTINPGWVDTDMGNSSADEGEFSKEEIIECIPQIEYISGMVKNHIYPSNVIIAPDLSEKVMMRYIRKMGDDVIDNIVLAKADRLSARGEAVSEEMVKSNIDGLNSLALNGTTVAIALSAYSMAFDEYFCESSALFWAFST